MRNPLAFALAAVAAVLMTGCSAAQGVSDAASPQTSADFGHVHAIVAAGEGAVLLGTHTGLYTLSEAGSVTGPLGGADFDAMGLAAAGGILYASGHPGPTTPAELGTPHLGLIRSVDAGATWEPVAFAGQEDFHVLTAAPDGSIYAIGSGSATVRTSADGGVTWADGAEVAAVDLAVTAVGTVHAATQHGVQESRDGGATFTPDPDAPLFYLLEADPSGGLVGVDTDGVLWRSTGSSWENLGTTEGIVQALGITAGGAPVLVDDRGIVWVGAESTVIIPARHAS